MMKPEEKIYVAGHRGLVGSGLWRALLRRGYENLAGRTRAELDLTDLQAVRSFFREAQPVYVFLAAAKVGGIHANRTFPAEFLYENLQIQSNILLAARETGVRKLLFLGSSCIYPRMAAQPIQESALLTGPLEPTNECYAVAKIAGIKLCQALRRQHGCNFICAMPTNLYGPGDNYDLQQSHVLPALIRRFHEAKRDGRSEVVLWGSGQPRREFLHVDDLADACLFLMARYDEGGIINVGSGSEVSIRELAQIIRDVVGFRGAVCWDTSQPDGTPRKLLDCSRLWALGWRPSIELGDGIRRVYEEYRKGPLA